MKMSSPGKLKALYPGVAESFAALRSGLVHAGPIDAKTLEVIQLAAFTVARQESGFKSHCRRALDLGATPDEVRHAVAINLGATASIEVVADALHWIDEVLATAPAVV
jgi:alkylhydroperoxidase/carboxymuconolactone decarboxylase family protein YurZ